MSTYTTQQLDEASGFGRPTITTYPVIKFVAADSSKNKSPVKSFVLIDNSGKDLIAVPLGESIDVVFMTRGSLRLHKNTLTSNEVPNARAESQVRLYKTDKVSGKRSFEAEGKWKELKEKYALSTQQLPYVVLEDKIAKLIISPSSLSNYWEYLDTFVDNDKPYHFPTTIKAADKPEVGAGGEYYKMTFNRGKKFDQEVIDMMAEDLMDLRGKLKKNEEAYQVKQQDYEQGNVSAIPEEVDENTFGVDENGNVVVNDDPEYEAKKAAGLEPSK